MVLPIRVYPDKLLRDQARQVKFPLSPAQKKNIKDMFDTVSDSNGIGLAAPQVGSSERIIVVNLQHIKIPMFALINPIVTEFSKKKAEMEEGCLSIPGVYGIVERPEKIVFSGYDLLGKKISAEADGLLARVIQHEIDHLNGVLIIDKIKKYTQGKDLIA